MNRVTTHEVKTHLSKLLSRVQAGEQFLICRGDTPLAVLSGFTPGSARTRPRIGTVTSQVTWTEDAFRSLGESELADWGL